MIKKMKMKNDSRVKTRKGSLEQKQKFSKTHGRSKQKNERQWPDSIRILYEVLYPFQNKKFELLVLESLPPNFWVYHGGSWRMSNYHIQRLEKMNLFKMLDFQRICFSRKRPWKCATFLFNQICENKSFEPDH